LIHFVTVMRVVAVLMPVRVIVFVVVMVGRCTMITSGMIVVIVSSLITAN